jgi:hypothetical protein
MTTLFKLLAVLVLFFLVLYGVATNLPKIKQFIDPKILEYKAERTNLYPDALTPEAPEERYYRLEGKG